MILLTGQAPLALVMVGAFLAGVAQDVFVVLWTTALQREIGDRDEVHALQLA